MEYQRTPVRLFQFFIGNFHRKEWRNGKVTTIPFTPKRMPLTNISAALNASDPQFPNILITIPYIFKRLNRPEMAAITGCRTIRLI